MQTYGLPKKQEELEVIPLKTMFEAYCRMDPLSDAMNVDLLPLSQVNKWLTSARLLDMSHLTTTDTDLSTTKKLDLADMKLKMQTSGKPLHPRDMKFKDMK